MPKQNPLKQTANVSDDMAAVIDAVNKIQCELVQVLDDIVSLKAATVPNQLLLDEIASLKEAIASHPKRSSRKAD